MKTTKLNTMTIFILISILYPFCAKSDNTIYKWTDENGKVHFDNNGANSNRKNYTIKRSLQSIKWESAKVSFSPVTKRANKQQQRYNKQFQKQCLKTTKRITTIKKQLVKPLIAEKFDAFQAELRKLRWTKRKVC